MKNTNISEWVWIPNHGIGVIEFGTPIQNYISILALQEKELAAGDTTGWGSYEIVGMNKNISTENEKIVSISCEDDFIYKGKNLIGMTEKELIAHMGQEPNEIGTSIRYEDGSLSTPFEYDDLGLIAWFEDNKLLSVSCSNANEL